jgi:hypothetical protein
MDLGPLARLQTLLRSFPSDWAYGSIAYVYDPSSHTYDWTAIEQDIGVPSLPSDYKQLMDGYGPLVIAGIFIVDPDDFAAAHELHADSLRDWWSQDLKPSGPIHPEPGGLLFCASTEGRETLWWDRSHTDPDQWTITWDAEFHRYTFNGTLTELLVAELTGHLRPRLTAFTLNE